MSEIIRLIGFSTLILSVSMLSSILGFGGLLILIAGFSLFMDIKYSIALGTIFTLTSSLTRTVIFREYIDKKLVPYLFLGIIPGSILGLFLFSITKSKLLSIIFGVFIIAYVVNHFINPKFQFKPNRFAISSISFIFASSSSLIGATGPIMVMLMQQLKNKREEFIAMMAVIYTMNGILKFAGYLYLGVLNFGNMQLIISIILFSVIGSVLGKKLVHKIPQKILEYSILALLLVYGIHAIWGNIA
jgi:uncharacterized membrane protein YfcA